MLADGDALIWHLTRIGAVLLIVDPFNHAHGLDDGNNNVLIASVAREVTRVARESSAAGLVLHHLRKGATGNPDDFMGATALRATFRAVRILMRMMPAEAIKLKLPPDKPWWRHTRIAGTKENYAPPPEFTTWYRFESVDLGNSDEAYPDGDNVQVTTLWTPPSTVEGISLVALKTIFDTIRRGPPNQPDEFYCSARQTKDQWVGIPIARTLGGDHDGAATLVASWIKNQVLLEHTYKSACRRKPVVAATLNEAKAAEMLGPLYYAEPEIDE